MVNVGFIGAGNMGYAIIKGICGTHDPNVKLFAYDTKTEMLERLVPLGVGSCGSAAELTGKCGHIFLAVKPQQLEGVLEDIAPALTDKKVIISICAGISAEYIKSKTIPDVKVIPVMPNTPLLLGEGASALAKCADVPDDDFEFVKNIFASCGKVAVVPENKMREVIAVNGSSPAFIYLFAQAFTNYAESVGIDGEVAKELFAQSLIGSAKMITDSGKTIPQLIEMVSSKGGTTIAGLEKLREGGLEETVKRCCQACTKRAYELSK